MQRQRPADTAPAINARKNVLYILADDLRPEFGFTDPQLRIRTPNFDRFARSAVYFGLAFAQVPFCVPSRASFLTGMRPQTTRSLDNDQAHRFGRARELPLKPGWTVFDAFRQLGYATAAVGKIFHMADEKQHGGLTYPILKDTQALLAVPCERADATNVHFERLPMRTKVCDLPFGSFVDQRVVSRAQQYMHRLVSSEQPWLLAVGFHRPHNPLQYPTHYLDIQAAANATDLPKVRWPHSGQPPIAYGDVVSYRPWRTVASERSLRRYYRGAVSHLDALLGELLKSLHVHRVYNSTLVLMHSDHSTSMGENGAWLKRSAFEHATRVPLFVRDPSAPHLAGCRVTRVPVQLIDVLPRGSHTAPTPTTFDALNAS